MYQLRWNPVLGPGGVRVANGGCSGWILIVVRKPATGVPTMPTGRPRRAEHSVPPGRIQWPTCEDCGQMVPNGFSRATCHKGAKEMCAPPPE